MSDDDLPELTPEQRAAFRQAAATLREEDIDPEDMAAIRRGWLGLVKGKAYSHPGWHYEMPEVRGLPPRGSFRLDLDILKKLGNGDLKKGAAVAAGMFSVEHGDDPTIIHPDVVRDVGHGSHTAGIKVLQKFVARIRHGARDGVILEHDGLQHDDGSHGWSVRR